MPGGLLASEANPATSLSKYFHDLPDPGQSSSAFCNSFWGRDDRGVEVLFDRMHGAAQTMEEVRRFWKERIAIEEEYATKLAELAKLPLGTDEIGDLRAALDTLRGETDAQATRHFTFVQTMKRELEQPCNDFIGKQNNYKKTFQAAIEKSYKAKQTQEKYVERAREKYESDSVLINSYAAQSTLLQGKELDKVRLKLERVNQTVQANERDYENHARRLGDTFNRWKGEWKTYCDQCQDLEDERIDFIKDIVWAYANAVSTVCVSDDESCEKIRVSLELVDADKEMENFVKYYGTGPMITEPIFFISYKQSSPPRRPNQNMATFLRSSTRVPLINPTLPVGSPVVGLTGPGAAGSASSGIVVDESGQVKKDPFAEEYARPSQNQQQPARAVSPETRRSPPSTAQAAPLPPPPKASSSAPSQVTEDWANVLFYVKALYDYKATIPEEFDFQSGDIIAVTATPDDGWWSGILLDDTRRIPGRTIFPSNFVCLF
ncbi:hypothetical protein M407DRAFT_229164 [Tulasnella calospora MUT 4182]|uniref:SH3 domain-containing protein n=1 Tax=Tulasnella calospora MUT 4182 TaxID=1051891 RepID=A0A0C3QNX6_9AGAM|nr:hypothetical protein M407DRAFT_229164 [Tulasnella calospora MUT 4182]